MSTNNAPHTSSSDGNVLVMILAAVVLLGSAGTVLTVAWSKVLSWCLRQQVLLPAAADPLLVLPHSGGVGLDLPRVAVAAAVLVVVLAATAGAATHKLRGGGEQR